MLKVNISGTTDSVCGSPPASTRRTVQFFPLSRSCLASVAPAAPAPRMMKSNLSAKQDLCSDDTQNLEKIKTHVCSLGSCASVVTAIFAGYQRYTPRIYQVASAIARIDEIVGRIVFLSVSKLKRQENQEPSLKA